jgi:aminoglycoside 6-adenylyltransferase
MQFMDGNRIDLNLYPLDHIAELEQDSLTRLLLDKDGVMSPLAPASELGYFPKPPTAKAYDDCCNEFWWVCPYAAKGLWRGEILYAKHVMDEYIRKQLMKMLVWRIGAKTEFSINPGKFGKYYQRYLDPNEWSLLLKTFADADYEHTWEALFAMCVLFREAAGIVADNFGYAYPESDDRRVFAHLQHVRMLPRDATKIY